MYAISKNTVLGREVSSYACGSSFKALGILESAFDSTKQSKLKDFSVAATHIRFWVRFRGIGCYEKNNFNCP